ncbi:hypothetical protein RJ639_045763 [Escallonia herrerae]|uniref:Uncharacterized protein n=1 Tax=Escallonia herrerae TaxID=1293975 RepID=A0AA88W9K3_9ASTE|nr:hypothetical protein RJ639_045763 [Escallonia herrerae]
MVTLLAWMAHRLVSSKRPTRYASAASCSAATAELWNRRSVLKSWAISLTSLWKGSFLINSSVLFWYFRISLSATVPGLNLCGFLTPPVAGADFLAALVASCFLGAFPPVDFLAVCLRFGRCVQQDGTAGLFSDVSASMLRQTLYSTTIKDGPLQHPEEEMDESGHRQYVVDEAGASQYYLCQLNNPSVKEVHAG